MEVARVSLQDFEKEGIKAELTIYRSGAETFDTPLEAMSVAVAVISCTPPVRTFVVTDQFPKLSAIAVPTALPSL